MAIVKSIGLNPLHGHRAERENLCHDCQGPLRDDAGGYHTRFVNVSSLQAYAAAICRACWTARTPQVCGIREKDEGRTLSCYLAPHHRGKCKWEVLDEGDET